MVLCVAVAPGVKRSVVCGAATALTVAGCNVILGYDAGEVDAAGGGAGGQTSTATGTAFAGGTGGAGGSGGTGGAGAGAGGRPAWSTPQIVASISSAYDDDDPSFTADRLQLYFNSDRDGDFDIFRSIRASPYDSWSQPEAVSALNTAEV
jgi:hypothetical protein